jgi:hypothetical protein
MAVEARPQARGHYFEGFADGREASANIACWTTYNPQRAHQAFGHHD